MTRVTGSDLLRPAAALGVLCLAVHIPYLLDPYTISDEVLIAISLTAGLALAGLELRREWSWREAAVFWGLWLAVAAVGAALFYGGVRAGAAPGDLLWLVWGLFPQMLYTMFVIPGGLLYQLLRYAACRKRCLPKGGHA